MHGEASKRHVLPCLMCLHNLRSACLFNLIIMFHLFLYPHASTFRKGLQKGFWGFFWMTLQNPEQDAATTIISTFFEPRLSPYSQDCPLIAKTVHYPLHDVS